jgi:ABC-type amino acid transport substrate-binding protein
MKSWLACLVLGLGAALTAAGPAAADELSDVLAAKKLRAGICMDSEPIGFRDAQGKAQGYDVDVATLMAKDLGVDLEIVEVLGSTRIPMLLSKKIDIIICNITATLERAKAIDFSFPYLRVGIKLVAQKDEGITGFADLKGKKVIVGRGTTGEVMMKQRAPEAELIYVELVANAVLLLRQHKADAYIEDSSTVDYIAKTYPDQLVTTKDVYSSDSITFGVRKDNPEFLRWLDLFASTYVTSGTYQEYYKKWWGSDAPPLHSIW